MDTGTGHAVRGQDTQSTMLPIRLLDFALEAFRGYLTDIFVKLTKLGDESSVADLHLLCDKLENIICEFIPTNIADFVTENLMIELFLVYNNHLDHAVKQNLNENFIESAVLCLCSAVVHPSVKRFTFSRAQVPVLSKNRVKAFVDSFLKRTLKKLKHIKTLKLEIYKYNENIITEHFKMMPSLEELTFFGCTNTILEVICNTCEKLRFLDVRNSVNITDASVESLLKLKHLEHLNIQTTSILPQGIEKILLSSANTEDIGSNFLLQSFKSDIEHHHVALISKCFPNLRSLNVCVHEYFNLIPFKYLKNLSQLTISFNDVEDVSSVQLEELLNDVGCQLISLKLYDFREDEFMYVFRIIGENCDSLKWLSLCTVYYYWQYLDERIDEAENLPQIKAVQYFEVRLYSKNVLKAILPKLTNIKEIKLLDYKPAFWSLFLMWLHQLKTYHLDKLHIDGYSMQLHGDYIVVSKLNGSYAFFHLEELKSLSEELSRNDNINIVDDCFMDIPNYFYLQ